jgi:hypothetical protein
VIETTQAEQIHRTSYGTSRAAGQRPAIQVLPELPRAVAADLDLGRAQDVERFVVVEGGVHAGRWFDVGDILICGGDPEHNEPIVLVARGFGRPRLGTSLGSRLMGDAGEPCHPDRWRSAGAVQARIRAGSHPYVAELVKRYGRVCSVGGPSERGAAGGRGGRSPAAQLSRQLPLFTAPEGLA